MASRKMPSDDDVTNALELKNYFSVPDANSEDILSYVSLDYLASK